jgi:type IV pilus assembly protein PilA
MSGSKAPLAEFYADKGRWPTEITSTIGNPSGKYTSLIGLSAGAGSLGLTLSVQAVFKVAGVNRQIQGSTLELETNDGGKRWSCLGGNTPDRLRPAVCK